MSNFLAMAWSQLRTIGMVFGHAFRKRATLQYPEEKPALPPRYRGRPVLTRDPDGQERCVACGLCAVVCPPDCIAIQKGERENGRWYAQSFQLNMSRCVFCGLCEEACPTSAIQLTPDFELGEYRRQDLLYQKQDLLISGPGKDPDYRYHSVMGRDPDRKPAHEGEPEDGEGRPPPVNPRSLLP